MTPPPIDPPGATTSWSGDRRAFPKKTARRIIARDKTCQLGRPGCTGAADVADHITGWADAIAAGWDPADIDDEANGQAACHVCHDQKTQEEAARGRARVAAKKSRKRPPELHPGLRW